MVASICIRDGQPYVCPALADGRPARPVTGLTVFLFSLAINFSGSRFVPRPELFTALFLTIVLLFLIWWSGDPAGVVRSRSRRMELLAGFGLMVVFIVWTNFHGAVAIGLGMLGATAFCDMVQDRFDSRSRKLVLLTLLCAAATCVNPYGLAYWEMLRPVGGEMFSHIVEWTPFWVDPAMPFAWFISALLLLLRRAWPGCAIGMFLRLFAQHTC